MTEWSGALWHAVFQALKWTLVWAITTGSAPILIWQLRAVL